MIASLLASLLLALAPASARTDDVQLAAQHLRDDHPNLFHDLSPAQFDAAVANLSAQADSLDDDQLLVGLMRLGAMPGVRDGHTGIFPLNPANRRLLHAYPIRMYTFADGTYVVGQAGGSDLLRARVVAVGGRPIEDVIAAVSPLVPHDNDSTLMLRVTTYLNTPEVLHGLGLVPDLGPVTFTFERGGNRFAASLTPLTVPEYGRGIGDLEHPLLPRGITAAIPAYVARRNQQIWTTTLAGKRVFYIGYNETLVSTAGRCSPDRPKRRRRSDCVPSSWTCGTTAAVTTTPTLPARRLAARFEDRADRRAHLADDLFRSREFRHRPGASGAPHLRRGAERRQPEPLRRHRQHAPAGLGCGVARRARSTGRSRLPTIRASRSIRRCRSPCRRTHSSRGAIRCSLPPSAPHSGAEAAAAAPPRFSYDRAGRSACGSARRRRATASCASRSRSTRAADRRAAYWTHPGREPARGPSFSSRRDRTATATTPAPGRGPARATRHRLADHRTHRRCSSAVARPPTCAPIRTT